MLSARSFVVLFLLIFNALPGEAQPVFAWTMHQVSQSKIAAHFQNPASFDSVTHRETSSSSDSYTQLAPPCDASFYYSNPNFCSTAANPIPVISGDPGGTFSSPAANLAFVSTSTGEINLAVSTVGGPYRIYYDSPNLCRDSFDVSIDALPTSANAGPDQTICANTISLAGNTPAVGTGTWTILAGTGTFTTPNAPTTTVTGASNGFNIFRWTISNGSCPQSSDIVNVNLSVPPSPAIAGPDQSLCGATNSNLMATVPLTGGASWTVISGGATVNFPIASGSSVSGLTPGANVFEWRTFSGSCPVSRDTTIIFIDSLPTPANAGADQAICGATTTLAGNVPSVGNGNWNVLFGPGTLTNAAQANSGVTGLGPGVNTLEWVVTNGSCPPSRDTMYIVVSINGAPANAGPNQTVCDTSVTLAAMPPTSGNGTWNVLSGGATVNNATAPTATASGLALGVNTLEWVVVSGSCPPTRDTVTIIRDAPPSSPNAGPDQNICASSTTLAGNVPAVGNGIWGLVSGNGTVTNPTQANAGITGLGVGANRFEWTITNGICPTLRDTVTIIRDAPPSPSIAGPDQNICAAIATLAGNSPAVGTGNWALVSGAGTLNSPTQSNTGVTGLGIGVNRFEWVISNGVCPPLRDTVTIFRDAPPSPANAGPSQHICTDTTTLASNVPAVGNGTWSLVSGTGNLANPSQNNTGVSGLSIGTNSFEWVISNGTCPPLRDTVTIIVDASPTVSQAGPDQNLCSSTSTMLAGNVPGIGNGTWATIAGSGTVITPTSANSAISGLNPGVNSFVWTISNGGCPSSSDTVRIEVVANPTTANAGPDQIICGDSTVLAGNLPLIGNGRWWVLSGNAAMSAATDAGATLTNFASDSTLLEWRITNGNCPPSADTLLIIRNLAPIMDAGADREVCGDSLILQGSGPGANTLWTSLPGAQFANPADSSTLLMVPNPGVYPVLWAYDDGICQASDSLLVTFFDLPGPAEAGSAQTVATTGPVNLQADPNFVGIGTWSVMVGNAVFSEVNSPSSSANGLQEGSNILQWTVSNGVCPSTSDVVEITLESEISIPTGFSPNGDNVNDKFTIRGISIGQSVQLTVFNRWGNQVYANDNYQNEWDGRNLKGEQLPDDTYFQVITISGQKYSGMIVLKR